MGDKDATLRGILDNPKDARNILDALTRDGVIRKTETGKYWSSEHKRITNQGKALVESALLGSVLPDYNLLRVAPPWIRNLLGKNLDYLSRLKARGEAWDLTADLTGAVELTLLAEASPTGIDQIRQYIAQRALPGMENEFSPRAKVMAMAMVDNKPREFRQGLKNMAGDAAQDVPGQRSFIPVKSAAESFAENFGKLETLNQPMNPDVDPNEQVEVVDLSEVTPIKNMTGKEARAFVNKWIGARLKVRKAEGESWPAGLYKPDPDHIFWSAHVKARRLSSRRKALNALDRVISNSVLIESLPNKDAKKTKIATVHRFYTPVSLGGQIRVLRIVALEKKGSKPEVDGVELYDLIEERKPPLVAPGGTGATARGVTANAASPKGTSIISIREMLNGVKDSTKKAYYLPPVEGEKTLNQAIRPTDTPAFRRWFDDSKVVDEQGKPLVVYHGTDRDFEGFEKSGVHEVGDYGEGFYFAESPEASGYALKRSGAARVYPVFLSIQKPFVIYRDSNKRQVDQAFQPLQSQKEAKAFSAKLRKQGYDGVIVKLRDIDENTGENLGEYIAEIVAFSPTQIKSIYNPGTWNPADPRILYQSGYHGSPHRFDRFSLAHLGTGEGAQAYGYGLYFAGKKEVAEFYRKALSKSEWTVEYDDVNHEWYVNDPESGVQYLAESEEDARDYLELHQKDGQTYKVDLPEGSELLDWDKPLSEQPDDVFQKLEKIKNDLPEEFFEEVLENLNADFEELTGKELYRALERWSSESPLPESDDTTGNLQRDVSEYLNRRGIKGHRYLDGNSRGKGEGSHNYVIYDDQAVEIINTLYQARMNRRGATHFGPDGKALIQLFKHANASTIIHELGHVARRSLADLARSGQAPEQVAADWRTMARFVGADPADPWTVAQEEKFAEAFEQYMMEGRAPAPGLRSVFERFRRWLLSLYRAFRDGQRFEINDDARSVFDRLLATDAEIAQARAEAEIHPFLKPEDIPYSERQGYQDIVEAARAQAAQNVMDRRLRNFKRHLAGWRREGREMANEHPGHILLDAMMDGGGVSPESVGIVADDATVKKLAGKRVGLVRKDGKSFTDAAFDMGKTPIEVLQTILDTPTKTEIIDAHVKEQSAIYREEAKPFEMAVSGELEALLNKEAELIERKAGRSLISPFVQVFNADEVSIADLEAMRMEDMRADYRRVAKLALDAYRGGKLEEAARQKRIQAAKAQKIRQAAEVRREIAKNKRYLKRVSRIREQRLDNMGGIEESYLHQIKSLVSRYMQLPLKFQAHTETPGLAEFVENLPPEDRPPISDDLIHQTGRWDPAKLRELATLKKDGGQRKVPLTPMGAMDRSMLRELAEAVAVLEHMGRREKQYIAFDRQLAMGQAVGAVVEAIEKNFKDELHAGLEPVVEVGETPGQEAKRGFADVAASLEIPEFIVRRLDGIQDLGKVWEYVFRPINQASDQALLASKEAGERMRELYQIVPKEIRKSWGKRRHIDGLSQTLTGQEVLCAALNAGNQENLDALQIGYAWTDEQLAAVLDSVAEPEWRFVQTVWDYLDTFFPEIDETHYQMFGKRVPKVAAEPVKTKYGTLRGGYYPLQFDRRKSRRIEKFKQREADLDAREHEFQIPWVRRGFTKERTGGKHPVLLDLSVLSGHVQGAIHFITHAQATKSVHRLLQDDHVRWAIESAVGEPRYRQLQTWLVGVARPEKLLSGTGDRWLKAMNDNYVTAALAYNLMTALKQPLALTQGMARVGVGPVLKAVGSMAVNPLETIHSIQALSPYMLNRQKSLDRDLGKAIRQGWGAPEEFGQRYIRDWGFRHIGFMDTLTAYPVWWAAYNQGLGKYQGNQSKAVEYADMQVRNTQGSGLPKDLAAVSRGSEWQRTFTVFYSFFSSTHNLMKEEASIMARDGYSPRAVMRFSTSMALIWIIPSVLEGMMNEREAWDPLDAVADVALFPLATIPFVRELASAFKGFRFGGGPVGEITKQVMNLSKAATADEMDPWRMVESATRLAGGLPLQKWGVPGYAGLPSNQIATTMRGARDLIEGENKMPEGFTYLFIREREK